MISSFQNDGKNGGIYLLMIILVMGLMTATGKADDEHALQKEHINSRYDLDYIFSDVGFKALKEYATAFNTVPLYYHVDVGKGLLSLMKTTSNLNTIRKGFNAKGYGSDKKRHNINTYGGRAAWMFERFFDVELPSTASKQDEETFSNCREQASEYLQAYQDGLIAVSSRQHKPSISTQNLVDKYKDHTGKKRKVVKVYRSAIKQFKKSYQFEVSIKSLKEKYSHKITPGNTNRKTAKASSDNFKNLLAEWMPIGKPLNELARIVGEEPMKQPKRYPDDYLYMFSDGREGRGYAFFVKSGTIRSVTPTGY